MNSRAVKNIHGRHDFLSHTEKYFIPQESPQDTEKIC